MSNFLGKKYALESSDNFEEYMKAIGVGLAMRKIGNNLKITVELLEKDGQYTFRTTSALRNKEVTFKPDQEFDEETEDGRQVKTVISVEKDKIVQRQTPKDANDAAHTLAVRTFTDTELVAVLTVKDVVCTRRFKLVA